MTSKLIIYQANFQLRTLADISEAEAGFEHPANRQPRATSRRRFETWIAREIVVGENAGILDQREVMDESGEAQRNRAGLARAEQIAGPAQFEVGMRDFRSAGSP